MIMAALCVLGIWIMGHVQTDYSWEAMVVCGFFLGFQLPVLEFIFMEEKSPLFMAMESVQQDHDDEDLVKEVDMERVVSASSPNICGVSGSPNLNPRIGDDYQVKIPTLMSESEYVQLLKCPLDSEGTPDASVCFLKGLPISIMVIHDKVDREGEKELKLVNAVGTKKSSKSGKNKKVNAVEKTVKDEPVDDVSVQCEKDEEPLDDIYEKIKLEKAKSKCRTRMRSCLVPGVLGSSWDEDQVESFILGLYIFGKSFVPVQKFVDNKGMGDVLSFYYGRFYGSDRYNRWSDSRKVKRKKFISGEKLFTGWRQQELISRLQPHIPESYQKTFQEMSEAMAEGKIPLEDYVSGLKTAVGIQVLVEAIGIGKGKEDLTNPAMESSKTNMLFPSTSKACSSLTTNDIVNLLTSGFRLSKARCNDIFWEAVWPRLLAKGWHSEQPNNLTYLDAKTYLVFLVPGVRKYSRRDLVKGIQYFDSVNDVLSKVASEPKLMELGEADQANGSQQSSELDDSSAPQSRHNYLKPRVSNGGMRSVKFTVVDSSSLHGVKLVRAKRMRYSPRDLIVTSMVTKMAGVAGTLSVEDTKDEDEEEDAKDVKTTANEEVKAKYVKIDKAVKSSNDKSSNNSVAKFTIVDTSVVRRDKSSKIFELRHLPSVDDKVTRRWINLSKEDKKTDKDLKVDDDDDADSAGKESRSRSNVHGSDKGGSEPAKPSSAEESNGNQSRKTAMQQFSRRPKSGNSNNLVPLVKRRRLIACISTEMNQVMPNFPGKLGSQEKKIRSGLDSSSKAVRKIPDECADQGSGIAISKAGASSHMKHEREPLLVKLPGLLGSKGKKVRDDLEAGPRAAPSSGEPGSLLLRFPCKLGSKRKKILYDMDTSKTVRMDDSLEVDPRAKQSTGEGRPDKPDSLLLKFPNKHGSKRKKVRHGMDLSNDFRRNNGLEFGPDNAKPSSAEGRSDEHGSLLVKFPRKLGSEARNVPVDFNSVNAKPPTAAAHVQDMKQQEPECLQESETHQPETKETETSECVTSESRNVNPGGILSNPVSTDPGVEQQQSDMGCRRQSRRNRPLTTRALEALEYEFLNVKKRPRSTTTGQERSSSRRARNKKTKLMSSTTTYSADSATKLDDVVANEQKIENGATPSSIHQHSEGTPAASTKETPKIENGAISSGIDEHCDGKPVAETYNIENGVKPPSIDGHSEGKPASTTDTHKMENRVTTSSFDEHSEGKPALTADTDKMENGVTTSSVDEQHSEGKPASTTDPQTCCCPSS
ncbi:hypothetical protein LINGRAHAP2_LOCUS28430 [Linum grandiflorum]